MAGNFWFTSDLHLGHEFCIKDRGFENADAMREKIYSMFDPVTKDDFVYLLGDIAWSQQEAQNLFLYLIMKKKVADIYVIQGNHDTHWLKGWKFEHPKLHICQTMLLKGNSEFHQAFLSHYPHLIWDKSHYGAYCFSGHTHINTSDRALTDVFMDTGKRFNVCCEMSNYHLWNREEIEEKMHELPCNIDHYLVKGTDKQKELIEKEMKIIHNQLEKLQKKLSKLGEPQTK